MLLKLNVKDFQIQLIQITLRLCQYVGSLIVNLESLKTGMDDSVKGL
jgi:hypothetical protein